MRTALRIFFVLSIALGAWAASALAQPWRGPIALGLEVTDQEGDPVPGAEVRLEYAEVEPYSGPPPITTDAAGRAEVFGLAEGLWRAQVDKEDYSRYLVVLRLDAKKKRVLITAGPLRDAVAPPLEVEFSKTEARRARAPRDRDRGDRDRDRDRDEERRGRGDRGERGESGRISEREPAAPEPPPQPTVRIEPEPAEPQEPRPEPEPREPRPEPAQPVPAETPAGSPSEEPPTAEPPTTRPPAAVAQPGEPQPAEPQPVEPQPGIPERQPIRDEPPPEATAPEEPEEAPRRPERALPEMGQPALPAPEPAPPGPVEPGGPPRPASQVMSYQDGTCSDCKPGEAATAAVAAAAGRRGGSGACPAGFTSAVEEALELLAENATALDTYIGPLVVDGQVVAVAEEGARRRAQELLGPYLSGESSCQVLLVVLGPSVKFTGYRYEARQGSRGGDCLAGQDCPIGGAVWPEHPRIERKGGSTIVWSVFENRAEAPRQAELTVYLDPDP